MSRLIVRPPAVTVTVVPIGMAVPPGTSQITVTLTNGNAQAVTAVSFLDTYPAGLVNTGTPGVATTCATLPARGFKLPAGIPSINPKHRTCPRT